MNGEMLAKLNRIELVLIEGLRQLDGRLAKGQEFLQLFDEVLAAQKQTFLKDTMSSSKSRQFQQWSEKIRCDKELRFPHRKILDSLFNQYNPTTGEFKETHFSSLVKAARIGKNMAKSYLSFLEHKGYIQRREDGYRKFFKLIL